MLACNSCWINCGGTLHWLHDCYVLSLYFQASIGLTNIRVNATFFRTVPFVEYILFQVQRDFVFRMHKYGFQSVGAFEDYLHFGMAEDSSKFFTEARNTRDTNLTVFLHFQTNFWIYNWGWWYQFMFFDDQIWVVVLSTLVEIIHFSD